MLDSAAYLFFFVGFLILYRKLLLAHLLVVGSDGGLAALGRVLVVGFGGEVDDAGGAGATSN